MELSPREKRTLIASIILLFANLPIVLLFDYWISSFSVNVRFFPTLFIIFTIICLINIVWILHPRKLHPQIITSSELQNTNCMEEMFDVGIVPKGVILQIIDKVAYSDPAYARKRFRAWPWRAKGKIILTDKELVFISVKKKKINFLIPISAIHSFREFVARGGSRKFKVCELVHIDPETAQQESVLFMGTIGFGTFDMPSEIELKSMYLLEHLQKWYKFYRDDL
ncbi:MAG: hypothetical protein ACTSRS_11575 [Candidatus Helarchaeota archaeon]